MIGLGDVLNFFEYEKVREERRRRVIALKAKRRLEVGPYLSFVFENRETLLFQIQEMCRVERIVDDARVQEEIDVYELVWQEAEATRMTGKAWVLPQAGPAGVLRLRMGTHEIEISETHPSATVGRAEQNDFVPCTTDERQSRRSLCPSRGRDSSCLASWFPVQLPGLSSSSTSCWRASMGNKPTLDTTRSSGGS